MKLRQDVVHSVCGKVGIEQQQSFKGPSHFLQCLKIHFNIIFKSVCEYCGIVQHQSFKGPSHWKDLALPLHTALKAPKGAPHKYKTPFDLKEK